MSDASTSAVTEQSGSMVTEDVASAARWFWWIAGLSLINTALHMFGSETHFVVGLAITTVFDVIFEDLKIVALFLDVIAIGFFVGIGWFSLQGKKWAFILGMLVYLGDGLIYLWVEEWMSVAFHAVVLVFLARGMVSLFRQ